LHQLTDLDLHGNNISVLPAELGRLLRLEKLRIDLNPINNPPYEILTKDVRTIIYYLRDRIESERTPVS
jgi:Leucine-rich repeat (LRR) protein